MLRETLKRWNEHIEGHELLDAALCLLGGLFLIAEIFIILLLLEP